MANARYRDMSGEVYGMLTVVERVPREEKNSYWKVRCECGNELEVSRPSLVNGDTRSCGCATRTWQRESKLKHGHSGRTGHYRASPEYLAWISMRDRCYNSNNQDFADYGGRGIEVCDRWRGDYAAFLEDMGPKPSPRHSLDRYPDQDGDYEPENCRWATATEQGRNKRSNRLLTVDGITKTASEWAEITGLGATLYMRLHYGWTDERAVKTPLYNRGQRLKDGRGSAPA